MKILVTGGAGYIGSACVAVFNAGFLSPLWLQNHCAIPAGVI